MRSGVGAAVLAARRVRWPVHVGQKRHFLYPQAVDDDMHMDVAAVVMPVRVGADKGLVAGEMLLAELLPSACARSTVRPLSGPSRGSKLMI